MSEIYNKSPVDKQEDWEKKVADQIIREWDKGRQYVTSQNEMYEDLYLMMRGKRPKKNYDWQSNLTLRKAFQVTWTAISYITQKIWGGNPVIGVEGFDEKGCWQRERLLDTWMAQDRYFLTMVLGLLRLLLNGVVIVKKGWKQVLLTKDLEGQAPPKWDENGNMVLSPEKQKRQMSFPLDDRPEDTVVNNKDVVVDWMLKPGQSITEGRFIIHREVVDLQSLYSSGINYMNLDDVERGTIQQTSFSDDHAKLKQEDQQENPPESDLYSEAEVFERQGAWPVKMKGDKIIPIFDKDEMYGKDVEWKQIVATVADKKNPVLIRWEENTYGEMTYFDGQLFLDPERWASQGMIEPAKDIFIAMDDNINAMFDEIWKNLFPPTMINKFAVQEWDSIQHAPHQIWLMQGNPNDNIMMPRGSDITRDAWQKHLLLDDEGRLITSVMPSVQGLGKEKTATQGVLNTQFSTGKLDFIIKMLETTWMIPGAKMTMRFAQKFAHPLTFLAILGEPFKFDRFLEEYRFKPVASTVKLPEQTEVEIQQDIQLMQIIASVNNPKTPTVLNYLLANILRNRNKPQLAQMFDESFYEPSSEAGNFQMMNRLLGPGTPSNEQGIPMSLNERSVRANAG